MGAVISTATKVEPASAAKQRCDKVRLKMRMVVNASKRQKKGESVREFVQKMKQETRADWADISIGPSTPHYKHYNDDVDNDHDIDDDGDAGYQSNRRRTFAGGEFRPSRFGKENFVRVSHRPCMELETPYPLSNYVLNNSA